ncbi:TPA: hypothetical protein TXZ05_002079 [Streptococcus suis]|nr:hypothetical protein [Streptococcus suis]HEL1818792.1 hypothetical protein [Streptococcus suis]
MKIVNIFENSSYTLHDEYVADFKEFLLQNPTLPITFNKNTLFFDEYTIGSISVNDLTIIINPRITNMTPNHYFEMELYNEGLLNDTLSTLLDENHSFGLQQNLLRIFLEESLKLVNRGIEGTFIIVKEHTNVIKGRILASEITPMNLLQDLIPVEYTMHTIDTSYNKIIKLALQKIAPLVSNSSLNTTYSIISSYFTEIDVFPSDFPSLLMDLDYHIFPDNNQYPIVIGIAIKILRELKLNMKDHKVLGSSYLVNSNNLFEKYARNVLSRNLKISVSKWDTPKNMGQFSINDITYYKSYIPDILLDYNSEEQTAMTVFDAKNKDISKYQNIASLPDLYQILFYCYSLKTTFGGLIYPYFGKLAPIKINVDSFQDNNLFIFTIDFSQDLRTRNTQFVENIRNILRVN